MKYLLYLICSLFHYSTDINVHLKDSMKTGFYSKVIHIKASIKN